MKMSLSADELISGWPEGDWLILHVHWIILSFGG